MISDEVYLIQSMILIFKSLVEKQTATSCDINFENCDKPNVSRRSKKKFSFKVKFKIGFLFSTYLLFSESRSCF